MLFYAETKSGIIYNVKEHPRETKGVFLFLRKRQVCALKVKITFPKHFFRGNECFDEKTTPMLLIECVAILLGDYDSMRKKAANILMKLILNSHAYEAVCEMLESEAEVTDRRDSRVRKWTKEVVSKGYCEECGSTENLEAHHIAYWSESPKDRINVKNGQCLCHKCHCAEHKDEHVYALMISK